MATKLKNLKLMEVLSEEGADMNIQSYKEVSHHINSTAILYTHSFTHIHAHAHVHTHTHAQYTHTEKDCSHVRS